jgi:hypothetical protein
MNSDVDLKTRKTIVHAVDKGTIMSDLGGVEEPIYQLFPLSAPYCDVYLTPKLDYDLEKAKELNCDSDESDEISGALLWIIILGVTIGILGLAAGTLFFKWSKAEKALCKFNEMIIPAPDLRCFLNCVVDC